MESFGIVWTGAGSISKDDFPAVMNVVETAVGARRTGTGTALLVRSFNGLRAVTGVIILSIQDVVDGGAVEVVVIMKWTES